MTEHDGLTAEQEAERRWPVVTYDLPPYADMFSTMARRHFVEGAEWATEREKARAEAAEARVAELEGVLGRWKRRYEDWRESDTPAVWDALTDALTESENELLALTAPTTEAVTE